VVREVSSQTSRASMAPRCSGSHIIFPDVAETHVAQDKQLRVGLLDGLDSEDHGPIDSGGPASQFRPLRRPRADTEEDDGAKSALDVDAATT